MQGTEQGGNYVESGVTMEDLQQTAAQLSEAKIQAAENYTSKALTEFITEQNMRIDQGVAKQDRLKYSEKDREDRLKRANTFLAECKTKLASLPSEARTALKLDQLILPEDMTEENLTKSLAEVNVAFSTVKKALDNPSVSGELMTSLNDLDLAVGRVDASAKEAKYVLEKPSAQVDAVKTAFRNEKLKQLNARLSELNVRETAKGEMRGVVGGVTSAEHLGVQAVIVGIEAHSSTTQSLDQYKASMDTLFVNAKEEQRKQKDAEDQEAVAIAQRLGTKTRSS